MAHGFGLLRRWALLGALMSLAAVALAIPATAAAKVTSLTSCGTIGSPGKYRLDANVTATAEEDCFVISASRVRLSLNGHTITDVAASGGMFGIDVLGSGAKIVGPGTLSNFGNGIRLGGGKGRVRGVTATGNGDGIVIGSAGNGVRGSVTTGNAFGIVAAIGATRNKIIGNFAHGNSDDDLLDANSNCDSNVWRGNDFGTANQSCIR